MLLATEVTRNQYVVMYQNLKIQIRCDTVWSDFYDNPEVVPFKRLQGLVYLPSEKKEPINRK